MPREQLVRKRPEQSEGAAQSAELERGPGFAAVAVAGVRSRPNPPRMTAAITAPREPGGTEHLWGRRNHCDHGASDALVLWPTVPRTGEGSALTLLAALTPVVVAAMVRFRRESKSQSLDVGLDSLIPPVLLEQHDSANFCDA